jgi:hypothetical protein
LPAYAGVSPDRSFWLAIAAKELYTGEIDEDGPHGKDGYMAVLFHLMERLSEYDATIPVVLPEL